MTWGVAATLFAVCSKHLAGAQRRRPRAHGCRKHAAPVSSFRIGDADTLIAQALFEQAIFFPEIVDYIRLAPVHPIGEHQQKKQ